MLSLVISFVVAGIVAGVVAPLLVPGRRNMPVVVTILLGILGSFVGGMLIHLLFGRDAAEGSFMAVDLLGALGGALVVLLLFVAFGRRETAARREPPLPSGPRS